VVCLEFDLGQTVPYVSHVRWPVVPLEFAVLLCDVWVYSGGGATLLERRHLRNQPGRPLTSFFLKN